MYAVGLFGLACVVFIVSLKCPALEAHFLLHLTIVGLKVASLCLACVCAPNWFRGGVLGYKGCCVVCGCFGFWGEWLFI